MRQTYLGLVLKKDAVEKPLMMRVIGRAADVDDGEWDCVCVDDGVNRIAG